MKIVIHDVRDREKREKLREAAKFFLRELIPYHVRQNLKVSITLNPRFPDFGEAITSRPYKKGVRPTSFKVVLHPHKWCWIKLIKTLAHEIVHIKQFAIGEMFEPSDQVTVWKSRRIVNDNLPYHKHPWEVEAAGNEGLLWELWKNRHLY